MSGKPAARVTDPQACPLPGHGTNPITTGSPDVLFNNLPAATVGSDTACGGKVSSGSSTVLINHKLATMLGCQIDHGGVIVGGSGNIIIGENHTPAPFTPASSMAPTSAMTGVFDRFFQLLDARNGQPLEGMRYIATTASGKEIEGQTASNGQSKPLSHSQAEAAQLWVEPQIEIFIG
ncbi:PAAR domain-containing protein [Pseudomonas sp. CAU 1711]|uniref:PAAR domain-containing protein n=1 Tax=Pseudomonas sp. CAU 1711 TaxID=3140356 RepID=UPI0032618304